MIVEKLPYSEVEKKLKALEERKLLYEHKIHIYKGYDPNNLNAPLFDIYLLLYNRIKGEMTYESIYEYVRYGTIQAFKLLDGAESEVVESFSMSSSGDIVINYFTDTTTGVNADVIFAIGEYTITDTVTEV